MSASLMKTLLKIRSLQRSTVLHNIAAKPSANCWEGMCKDCISRSIKGRALQLPNCGKFLLKEASNFRISSQ